MSRLLSLFISTRGVMLRILMFGWEFPPFFAGGVGMVCYELTKQLASDGIELEYVMPFCPDTVNPAFMKLHNAQKAIGDVDFPLNSVSVTKVRSLLTAYQTVEEYESTLKMITILKKRNGGKTSSGTDNTLKLYGENLLEEVELFALRVREMALRGDFDSSDVIHAHDWTTILASIAVKEVTGKPLIVHVHITEFNKTGNNTANPDIYDVEKRGFMTADKVVAVSGLIKTTLMEKYSVPEDKIEIVHNGGIEMAKVQPPDRKWLMGKNADPDTQVILYAGRVTGMKGPERFVEMASQVLKYRPNTLFVMAGSGDKLNACIDRTQELGIREKFHFFGFYKKSDAEKLYELADVFVLPSQLEPFGVTPLEAMCKETPVVITRQSGVAEVLDHCLINDFWDVQKMASNVVSLLTYPALHGMLKNNGADQARAMTWEKPANICRVLYKNLMSTN